MPRLTLAELERRCQKPDYRQSGNWMARRISRPAALHVTRVIAPSGVSAHAVTGLATAVALAAACCFGIGTIGTCFVGALLLQVWYLLDHVDGQVARLNGTASLDGIQLDYLMHHVVNLAVPFSLGYGAGRSGGEAWLLLGCAFALGLLLIGLANDTRYKAYIARLKQIEGPLLVQRRGADEVAAEHLRTSWFQAGLRQAVYLARKLCEIHVVMNAVTAIAVAQCWIGQTLPSKVYLAIMSPLALVTAVAILVRDVRRQAAEQDYAAWFAPCRRGSCTPTSAILHAVENDAFAPERLSVGNALRGVP
ncbi:MAG TPA: hypothetical protein VNH11_16665 [Pirellulales bacterium]|nr:hypothetical protein [Pirellulales bacterium]